MDAFAVGAEMKGLDDILVTLRTLGKPGAVNKIVKPAVLKGMRVVAKAVKANTSKGVALAALKAATPASMRGIRYKFAEAEIHKAHIVILESITAVVQVVKGVVVGKVGSKKGIRVLIGIRVRGKNAGKAIYFNPVRVLHLIEKGHGGPAPAQAHAFMRPGWDNSKAEAVATIAAALQDKLAARRGAEILAALTG